MLRTIAWDLIGYLLPDNCLDRVHILCPDPWPKARHRGNRLLSSEFIGRLKRVLKNNGTLHISTDDKPYLAEILEAISGLNFFTQDQSLFDDVSDIKTEFEITWNKQGKEVTHLAYKLKK